MVSKENRKRTGTHVTQKAVEGFLQPYKGCEVGSVPLAIDGRVVSNAIVGGSVDSTK